MLWLGKWKTLQADYGCYHITVYITTVVHKRALMVKLLQSLWHVYILIITSKEKLLTGHLLNQPTSIRSFWNTFLTFFKMCKMGWLEEKIKRSTEFVFIPQQEVQSVGPNKTHGTLSGSMTSFGMSLAVVVWITLRHHHSRQMFILMIKQ